MNEDTVRIEYVGLKDREVDHLYGTGIVWTGRGCVQSVPVDAWQKMKKHNDVWREASPPAAVFVPAEQAPPAHLVIETPSGKPGQGATLEVLNLESMDRPALAKLATARGLKFDGRTSRAGLIDLLTA